jgi:hypothetical protein
VTSAQKVSGLLTDVSLENVSLAIHDGMFQDVLD